MYLSLIYVVEKKISFEKKLFSISKAIEEKSSIRIRVRIRTKSPKCTDPE